MNLNKCVITVDMTPNNISELWQICEHVFNNQDTDNPDDIKMIALASRYMGIIDAIKGQY